MTLGELRQLLEELATDHDLPDETEIRLATQPTYPLEHTLDYRGTVFENRIYLAEGSQVGYLPGQVSEDIGWRR